MRLPREVTGWWPLWTILGLGLLLRLSALTLYTPTVFNYYGGDSTRYMRLDFTGVTGLFDDNAMPAGYPAFLAAVRAVSDWLPLTIALQHLLGLAGAALLYAAVVRLGAPRWAGLLPAAVVALSGDVVFLEHGIFTEALWMPALGLSMYLLAVAASTERARWWLVAAGVALACATLIRHVAQVLPVVLAVWAALALPEATAGRRLRNAAALLLPALAVLGVYFVVANPLSGGYSGLVENQGFSLYGRVAQFADCREFTPPAAARPLCVDTPPEQRPGPFFWTFGADSPLRTKISFDIYDSDDQELLAEFSRKAILNQPLDYSRTVAKDIARYFAPDVGTPRPESGADADRMSFESTVPTAQGVSLDQLADQFDTEYDGVGDGVASQTARTAFGAYQSVFRIDGLLTVLLIALGAIGWWLGRGKIRRGAALFLVSGLVLLLFPPLFSSYDVRYTVPPINLLAAAGAFGLTTIAARVRVSAADSIPAAAPPALPPR